MFLFETLRSQPRWLVLVEAFALVCLIGWVDDITASEWSFFVFYAVPIVLVVWRAGARPGYVFAFLCAIMWWVAQIGDNPYRTGWGFALAVASRHFYFAVLVVAVAAARTQRELDRARIASLERAQELEREILRTSENEQQRIGRDLHDSLGPHLAAISYAVTFLANDLRERDLPESTRAEEIRELVNEAISLTRGLARGIFPTQMEGAGLAIALKELAHTAARFSGASVSFFENGSAYIADPEVSMQLYRIAQEALNNAVKHGEAKNVTVVVSQSEGSMRLVIADDGKGMPPPSGRTQGIGLHSMSHRARSLGGDLKIESNPEEGTTVSCQIPLSSLGSTSR